MNLRALVLLAPLLAGAGLEATASQEAGAVPEEAPAMSVLPPAPVVATPEVDPAPVLLPRARAEAPMPSLEVIEWTVEQEESFETVASRWGLKTSGLRELNPNLGLRRVDLVPAGTKLRVYAASTENPTRSIGSPNKGRLQHGMPMPEGPYWMLRERRTRAYGASNTIEAMLAAFQQYGESFDDAPPVSVGELSARRGGRAAPHRSHRTGRDVDLGYILTEPSDGTRWKRADKDNFDARKNWALIKALVQTGEVQQIFISNRLQRLLRPIAREELSEEEMAEYFRVPGHDPSDPPILKHWDGHRDHMHVRFRCEEGNGRCRSQSSRKRSAASS